tara:strand:- start:418 stop:1917 length:1500 start_codon:yes stop_codon:yes gene_type:complete
MTVYKTLNEEDKVSTKTLLHEAIPITGTIVSGTYADENIQNFAHGMFQSVYDYPYLSSSANHIFDLSLGSHTNSSAYAATTIQKAKKNNIYNQMAQVLMGYNKDGEIQRFDEDGNISDGGNKLEDIIVVSFSRLLAKDEIKKGSFQMELGVHPFYEQGNGTVFHRTIKLSDEGAASSYKVNSPAGEYGILLAETSFDGSGALSEAMISGETFSGGVVNSTKPAAGLIFYQAGVAILSSSVFQSNHASVTIKATGQAGSTEAITIKSIDGASQTITAGGATNATTFNRTAGSKNGLDELKAALENGSSALNGKITVSEVQTVDGGFMITITQNTAGAFATPSHKAVTSNLANMRVGTANPASDGEFTISTGLLSQNIGPTQMNVSHEGIRTMLTGSQISGSADAIRNRIKNIQFNNTIELNSTVYFCRAKHNEFNYSSNPTYLTGSQIRVKEFTTDVPISYITSIGLYSADNQLLAVGKFSEPIRKDNAIELTFRARLDY